MLYYTPRVTTYIDGNGTKSNPIVNLNLIDTIMAVAMPTSKRWYIELVTQSGQRVLLNQNSAENHNTEVSSLKAKIATTFVVPSVPIYKRKLTFEPVTNLWVNLENCATISTISDDATRTYQIVYLLKSGNIVTNEFNSKSDLNKDYGTAKNLLK